MAVTAVLPFSSRTVLELTVDAFNDSLNVTVIVLETAISAAPFAGL